MSPSVWPVEGRDYILDQAEPLWPHVEKPEHADLLVEIIDSWDPEDEDRRALEMHAWQRATYREIAEAFGLSGRPSGFFRVQRAIKRLKEEMEKHLADSK